MGNKHAFVVIHGNKGTMVVVHRQYKAGTKTRAQSVSKPNQDLINFTILSAKFWKHPEKSINEALIVLQSRHCQITGWDGFWKSWKSILPIFKAIMQGIREKYNCYWRVSYTIVLHHIFCMSNYFCYHFITAWFKYTSTLQLEKRGFQICLDCNTWLFWKEAEDHPQWSPKMVPIDIIKNSLKHIVIFYWYNY